MKVEAEPQQPLLARSDERALVGRVALEQELALEHGGERRRGLVEVGADVAARIAEDANDDRADRLAEPPHWDGAEVGLADERESAAAGDRCLGMWRGSCRDVVSAPRERMHSTRAPSTRCQTDASSRNVEVEEEPELDLCGDDGRQLEQRRAGDRSQIEVERRGGERLVAHLCEGGCRDTRVGRVELAFGGKREDHVGGVDAGGECVGGVAVAPCSLR